MITDRMKTKLINSKTEQGLNLQQEEFCQLFIKPDSEFFGNGTQSYLKAYGDEYTKRTGKEMSYKTAQVQAYQALRSPKIINRINELLEASGFNEQNVDKQHLFLINQYADLKTKLGAIKEFNVLKKRIDALPQSNNFHTLIANIINEPKGHIIKGRIREVESETTGQELEDKQSVSYSEQGRSEDTVQTEQATDILTQQPTL